MVKSGPLHHWSGPHNRHGAGRARPTPVPECFRCTEVRRKLLSVRIVSGGTTLGTALLCGECLAELAPLDPDPLHVDEGSTAAA